MYSLSVAIFPKVDLGQMLAKGDMEGLYEQESIDPDRSRLKILDTLDSEL